MGGAVAAWAVVTAAAVIVSPCGRSDPDPSPVASSQHVAACATTSPGGEVPRGAPGFDFGNGDLAVVLWPGGTLEAGELADGSSFATVRADGTIEAKLGWWRGTPGRLHVSGERLDATAPPLRADVPDGYGDTGLQVSSVIFDGPGCWRIAGQAGGDELEIVVRVRLV